MSNANNIILIFIDFYNILSFNWLLRIRKNNTCEVPLIKKIQIVVRNSLDQDPDSMNMDPKHWSNVCFAGFHFVKVLVVNFFSSHIKRSSHIEYSNNQSDNNLTTWSRCRSSVVACPALEMKHHLAWNPTMTASKKSGTVHSVQRCGSVFLDDYSRDQSWVFLTNVFVVITTNCSAFTRI